MTATIDAIMGALKADLLQVSAGSAKALQDTLMQNVVPLLAQAIAAERERCAQIADKVAEDADDCGDVEEKVGALRCARLIRERKTPAPEEPFRPCDWCGCGPTFRYAGHWSCKNCNTPPRLAEVTE